MALRYGGVVCVYFHFPDPEGSKEFKEKSVAHYGAFGKNRGFGDFLLNPLILDAGKRSHTFFCHDSSSTMGNQCEYIIK